MLPSAAALVAALFAAIPWLRPPHVPMTTGDRHARYAEIARWHHFEAGELAA